jgi:serpin B
MKIQNRLALLSAAAVLTLGCSDPAAPDPPGALIQSSRARITTPDVSQAERAQLARDRATFALDLYRLAAGDSGAGNLFFSPHSISMALAMTWAGARGDTAAEMAAALDFTQGDRVHLLLDDLDLGLRATAAADFELSIVDQLFGQKDEPFVAAYLDLIAESYGAGLRAVDFAAQPERERVAINQWVADATHDRIQDLIPQGVIDPLTRLVLVNAIYFNARWAEPFEKRDTHDLPFHLLSGDSVSVPAMTQVTGYPYFTGTGFEAVELPYRGDHAALLVIVPAPGRFAEVESGLDAARLDAVVAGLATQRVKLSLPKFSFTAPLGLKALLARLGMRKAFDPSQADFSGLDALPLYVTDVIHKAFVRVDEEGTEAAAATAVTAGTTSIPIGDITLTVDRPFILLLRDRTSGALLFVGRVLDPR